MIGAGAIGASAARHLARRGVRVIVLEKETAPALHQSGRNSGVIHAGYNLRPGSLKVRYCVEVSRQLRGYCRDHGISLSEGGILIVARSEAERGTLRAQVVSLDGQLVDDIVVRETARTVHVLNAVSPGLTCSLPFGDHLALKCVDRLQGLVG